MAKARAVAARWLALLDMYRSGYIRRGESNFDVSTGYPHGGGGGCSSGDHGDWIIMVIMFESNPEVAANVFRRDGTEM